MGIEVASSFTRKAAVPLDDGFIKANDTARDAIPSGVRYEGMLVYVTGTKKMWQLQGGITNSDWKLAGGGGGGMLVVADYGALLAIPSADRYAGMTVYVTDTAETFQLQGGIADANWKDFGDVPLTAKGDIYVWGTDAARFPVGTDGYYLTPDSTATLGLAYKPLPAAGAARTSGGTMGIPTVITAAGGIPSSTSDFRTEIIKGPVAGVTAITALAQIAIGTSIGQELTLIGGSDSESISITDGNGVVLGFNETWESSYNNVLKLIWNGFAWVKLFRSDR